MARPKCRGSKPGRASSDSLPTDSKPVMKYGTIWTTSRIERSAPDAPGRANSGSRRAASPRASPIAVKAATSASIPKVRTFWNSPDRRMPATLTAAMTAVSPSPAASFGAVIARPATV